MELGRKIKSGARTMIEQAIIDGTNREGFLPIHKVENIVNRTLLNDVLKSWGYQYEYRGLPYLIGWTYIGHLTYVERPNTYISMTAVVDKKPKASQAQKFRYALLTGAEVVVDDVPLCRSYIFRITKELKNSGFEITAIYCDDSKRRPKVKSYKLTEQSAANIPF